MTLADRIVVLREGRIEQVGAPLELYARPANQFVGGFIGSPKMNLLPATAVSGADGRLQVALADGATVWAPGSRATAPGTALSFGIRPEHLSVVAPEAAALRGQVVVAERLGGETYFHVRSAGRMLVAKVSGNSDVASGAEVGLHFDPALAHLFIPDGPRLT